MATKKKASMRLKRPKRKVQATNGSGRAQRHEMDIRLDYVEGLLASGLRYSQVVKATMNARLKDGSGWDVCRKTAENYIAAVYKKWRTEEEEDRPLKKRRALERRRQIFISAINKGDFSAANKALDTLERMEGVAVDLKLLLESKETVIHEVGESTVDLIRAFMSDRKTSNKLFEKLKKQHASDSNKK